MSALSRTPRWSKEAQLNRALALLDRIISLIEEDDKQVPMTDVSAVAFAQIESRAPCWRDAQVKAALLSLYGRASSRDAANLLGAEFGSERAPSKSAVARIAHAR